MYPKRLVGKRNVLVSDSERLAFEAGPQEEVVKGNIVCDGTVVRVARSVCVDLPAWIPPDTMGLVGETTYAGFFYDQVVLPKWYTLVVNFAYAHR